MTGSSVTRSNVEIERKFLLESDTWKQSGAAGVPYRQGYLCSRPTVRIRVAGEKGFITIKGKADGYTRSEYEYEIPHAEAEQMLATLCVSPIIVKTRYCVPGPDGLVWEIDVFEGANSGLVIAEVELLQESQAIDFPEWVGAEVTLDTRFTNASLAYRPYSLWKHDLPFSPAGFQLVSASSA